MNRLGIHVRFAGTVEEAIERVTAALKDEGFGVLTEIDVKATLSKKLDVDFRPYKILGACNPAFAHRALSTDLQVGLLLPCNVIVYEEQPGKVRVAAIDPLETMAARGESELAAIAGEVREKLDRAMSHVGERLEEAG